MPVTSPQVRRKDRKRAEIVAVAKALFFQEGYAGASMAQIAARVGGSKATLYNHFKSKEELLLAVVRDVTDPPNAQALAENAPRDFRAWLVWVGVIAVRALTTHESLSMQRLAAAEALRFPEIGRIFYQEGVLPGHQRLAARFKDAMSRGELREADPLYVAEAFMDSVAGGWPLRRIVWNIAPPPNDGEIEARVKEAVERFLEGYAPPSRA